MCSCPPSPRILRHWSTWRHALHIRPQCYSWRQKIRRHTYSCRLDSANHRSHGRCHWHKDCRSRSCSHHTANLDGLWNSCVMYGFSLNHKIYERDVMDIILIVVGTFCSTLIPRPACTVETINQIRTITKFTWIWRTFVYLQFAECSVISVAQ